MILTFLATPLGRGAIVAVAVVLALIVNNSHQRSVGASKLAAKMEKASDANVKKADAARRAVDGLPDERLRDKWSRD